MLVITRARPPSNKKTKERDKETDLSVYGDVVMLEAALLNDNSSSHKSHLSSDSSSEDMEDTLIPSLLTITKSKVSQQKVL